MPDPDAEVHSGDPATYSVDVTAERLRRHGHLEHVEQRVAPPFGATAAPVSVSVPAGGSANATFTVETDHAATDLGPNSFRLRGESPGAADRSSPLDLRVLPDEGAFGSLTWQTATSPCGSNVATVTGTNVSFDGSGYGPTPAHTHFRYAWTPGCRGAVVMGTSAGPNAGWPVSIFNFGFDNAIADAPGSRFNLGRPPGTTTIFR